MGAAGYDLISIDWARADSEYRWETTDKTWGAHLTLPVQVGGLRSPLGAFLRMMRALMRFRPNVILVYGYHNPAFFFCAAICALFGVTMLTMNDSRFSDYRRRATTDALKQIMLMPYRGCLAASQAAADYTRFLGVDRTAIYYCAIDTARVKRASRPAFEAARFADRPFLIVSRFVEKKNLFRMMDAYADYVGQSSRPRGLKLIGYGPLEQALRDYVAGSPLLAAHVEVVGFISVSKVPEYIGAAFCLVLPSLSDQFGIVVTEALASGVPAIVSSNCGAADLVRSWRNGFVYEAERADVLTHALLEIDGPEDRWKAMSEEARVSAQQADVSQFLQCLRELLPSRLQAPITI